MNNILVLVLVVTLSGCTVFSEQNQLYPGLKKEIPADMVDITVHIVSPFTINYWCIVNGLNPILSIMCPGTLFGCMNLREPAEEGGKYTCIIYQAYDWDWIYQHEIKHCYGYDD